MLDNYETTTDQLCAEMGTAFESYEENIADLHPEWSAFQAHDAAAADVHRAIWED